MTPAEVLRERLEVARLAGAPFEVAWASGLRTALPKTGGARTDWSAAFHGTRDAWESAYLGDEPDTAAAAIGHIATAA